MVSHAAVSIGVLTHIGKRRTVTICNDALQTGITRLTVHTPLDGIATMAQWR